jgi:hypothetical protein
MAQEISLWIPSEDNSSSTFSSVYGTAAEHNVNFRAGRVKIPVMSATYFGLVTDSTISTGVPRTSKMEDQGGSSI